MFARTFHGLCYGHVVHLVRRTPSFVHFSVTFILETEITVDAAWVSDAYQFVLIVSIDEKTVVTEALLNAHAPRSMYL